MKAVPTTRESIVHDRTFTDLLAKLPLVERDAVLRTSRRYPVRITSYYAGLVRRVGDPLWRQCMPHPAELDDAGQASDPLAENRASPLPGLIRRYPDRVLLLLAQDCPLYCRFCTRKRLLSPTPDPAMDKRRFARALDFIRAHREIRDVLVSGGDPLLLSDQALDHALRQLGAVSHLRLVRIGSRVPCTWPQRITPETARMLGGHGPLFLNTHFNHPAELTTEAARALSLLAEAGVVLGCQTVLLKGVNDDAAVLRELFYGLLELRVRPYYLHIMDLVRGTAHFRVSLQRALTIYGELQGHLSGMALPRMMLDLPGGGGKIPLSPSYRLQQCGDRILFRNFQGNLFPYPELESDVNNGSQD